MDLGSRVRSARKALSLSQEALARRADISLNVLNRIETSTTKDPHYSTLLGIARGLGVPVSHILEESALPKVLKEAMIQEARAGAEQFSDFLENCWKLFNRYDYKPDLRKSSKGEVLRGQVEEHLELRDAIHGGIEDEVKAEAMDNVLEAFRAWHWAVRGCPEKPPWRLGE